MRAGLRGLTTRGRSFLAAAVAAAISAGILGEKDLLRVAVLLAILPLLAAAYVGRSRYKLACNRSLDPHRVPVGANSRVVLRLQNLSRLPTGTLLLEDRLPYALGSRPRVVLERLGAHQASSVAYTVRADVRGRYDVGPLVVRLTDPFGLCELTRSFPSTDHLTVIPQVTPLPSVRLAGEYAGSGDSRARSVAVHGEDDAATREYRRGDDLRRVHWRSTARTGELMVRREEQPWESRATVVLDTRAYGHRGEGPTASFEWAVSAAASIAVHLRQAGYKLRLVTGSGADVDASEAGGDGAAARPPRGGPTGSARRAHRPRAAGPPTRRRRSGHRPVRHAERGRGGAAGRAAGQRRHLRRLPPEQLHLAQPAGEGPGRGGARPRRRRPRPCCRAAGGWSASTTAAGCRRCGRRSAGAPRASPCGPRWPRRSPAVCDERKAPLMISSRNIGVVAAAATLLAAAPLSAIFQGWTWLIESIIAVAVVAGVAALTRLARAPLWGQVLGMLAGLMLALTWLFPSGEELLAILPTPGTFAYFGDLLAGSMQDMRSYGVEVPDTDPLLFIAVLGVGGVAVLVDVLAVGLRRPALAGLPMLAIYSVPVAVYVDSVPAVPFVVGRRRLPLAAGHRQRRPGTPVRPPVHRRRPRRRRVGGRPRWRPPAAGSRRSGWPWRWCCRWRCPA